MLQIIANSPAEAEAALAAGARWIHYCDPASLDAILTPCEQACAIVTIPGSRELQKETRVHGVILSAGDMPSDKAREYLGPNAVIGCRVSGLYEILAQAASDVDFFVVDAPISELGQIISMARAKGVEQRISALSDDLAAIDAGADALMTADLTLFNRL